MGQLASRQMPIVLAEQGRPILTLSEGMATELVAETDSGAQLSLIFSSQVTDFFAFAYVLQSHAHRPRSIGRRL